MNTARQRCMARSAQYAASPPLPRSSSSTRCRTAACGRALIQASHPAVIKGPYYFAQTATSYAVVTGAGGRQIYRHHIPRRPGPGRRNASETLRPPIAASHGARSDVSALYEILLRYAGCVRQACAYSFDHKHASAIGTPSRDAGVPSLLCGSAGDPNRQFFARYALLGNFGIGPKKTSRYFSLPQCPCSVLVVCCLMGGALHQGVCIERGWHGTRAYRGIHAGRHPVADGRLTAVCDASGIGHTDVLH